MILLLLPWCYLLLLHGRFWRHFPTLPAKTGEGRVIAVIPARNEGLTIARAVASLHDQVERVIVVDDDSTDDTAGAAANSGAWVVKANPLQPGWTGKVWAVSEGLRAAAALKPTHVLLTDADIAHAPGSIARLLSLDRDLASVMVGLHCVSFAERFLIPAFVFFFFKLYPPAWINHARRRTAGAAGGCMLIRAEALERIGGVERIRGAIIDDCALAREIKRTGGTLWLGVSSDSESLRSYGSAAPIWEMIARTAFAQLRHSPLLLAGTVAGMAALYLLPPLFTFRGNPYAAAAWLLMSVAYVPMLRLYRRSPLWAPLLPLAALFYTGATLDSARRYWTGRGGTWKGRHQDAS